MTVILTKKVNSDSYYGGNSKFRRANQLRGGKRSEKKYPWGFLDYRGTFHAFICVQLDLVPCGSFLRDFPRGSRYHVIFFFMHSILEAFELFLSLRVHWFPIMSHCQGKLSNVPLFGSQCWVLGVSRTKHSEKPQKFHRSDIGKYG